jgi:hypothetical protein
MPSGILALRDLKGVFFVIISSHCFLAVSVRTDCERSSRGSDTLFVSFDFILRSVQLHDLAQSYPGILLLSIITMCLMLGVCSETDEPQNGDRATHSFSICRYSYVET